jgi:hypothetical protein
LLDVVMEPDIDRINQPPAAVAGAVSCSTEGDRLPGYAGEAEQRTSSRTGVCVSGHSRLLGRGKGGGEGEGWMRVKHDRPAAGVC